MGMIRSRFCQGQSARDKGEFEALKLYRSDLIAMSEVQKWEK